MERSWTYRLGNGVDDSGEAHSIIQLLLFRADMRSKQQLGALHHKHSEFCSSHLLSLQLLLFPSLPLLLIHFADLDKSFLLHAHNTCISFTFSTTVDIFAEMHVFTFCVSMVSTWSPFGNLVQVRQIRNFSYKSTTTTRTTTATLTSSSASGRSAFFETWEPT